MLTGIKQLDHVKTVEQQLLATAHDKSPHEEGHFPDRVDGAKDRIGQLRRN
jgi:hypothetical protein